MHGRAQGEQVRRVPPVSGLRRVFEDAVLVCKPAACMACYADAGCCWQWFRDCAIHVRLWYVDGRCHVHCARWWASSACRRVVFTCPGEGLWARTVLDRVRRSLLGWDVLGVVIVWCTRPVPPCSVSTGLGDPVAAWLVAPEFA